MDDTFNLATWELKRIELDAAISTARDHYQQAYIDGDGPTYGVWRAQYDRYSDELMAHQDLRRAANA